MPVLRLTVPEFANPPVRLDPGYGADPGHVVGVEDREFDIPSARDAAPAVRFGDEILVHWRGGLWLALDGCKDPVRAFEAALMRRLIPADSVTENFAVVGGGAMRAQPAPAWVVRVFDWQDMMIRYERRPPERTTASAAPFALFGPDREDDARSYAARIAQTLDIRTFREFDLPRGEILRPDLMPQDWDRRTFALQMPCVLQNGHLGMPAMSRGTIEHWLGLRGGAATAGAFRRFAASAGTSGPAFGTDVRKWLRRAAVAAVMLAARLPDDDAAEDIAA